MGSTSQGGPSESPSGPPDSSRSRSCSANAVGSIRSPPPSGLTGWPSRSVGAFAQRLPRADRRDQRRHPHSHLGAVASAPEVEIAARRAPLVPQRSRRGGPGRRPRRMGLNHGTRAARRSRRREAKKAGETPAIAGVSVRAQEENRTPDLLITSELLCRLSYLGDRLVGRIDTTRTGEHTGPARKRTRHGPSDPASGSVVITVRTAAGAPGRRLSATGAARRTTPGAAATRSG